MVPNESDPPDIDPPARSPGDGAPRPQDHQRSKEDESPAKDRN